MPNPSHIIAIDQGTTSSRTLIFDNQANVTALAQQEFTQHFPKPGHVEHNATEIWQTQLKTLQQALNQSKLAPADIAAIGITNQRETTVLWDRTTGQPIHNAIVWQDRRTAPHIQRLKQQGHEQLITQSTGLIPDAYFSATKIAWLLEHIPAARKLASQNQLAFGTIDSWLLYNLTAKQTHATDATNASRTMLYNIHTGQWDQTLLDLFNIPFSILPTVTNSSAIVGQLAPLPGLEQFKGTPIASMIGDQQAALAGQLCTQRGQTKTTYGTGCFMLMHTGKQPVNSTNRLLTTIASQLNNQTAYALEGAVFTGGAVVQWLRDGLHIIKSSADVEQLAASVPNSDGIQLVPAFTGLGAPHWDPNARGTICGLTRGSTAAHIARAALNAIAHQVTDLIQAMQADSALTLTELRVDGGATNNNLLMQTQADFLNLPVVRPLQTESTALGAAFLAGLAVNLFNSFDDLQPIHKTERIFEPAADRSHIAEERAAWQKAVQRSLDWHTEQPEHTDQQGATTA